MKNEYGGCLHFECGMNHKGGYFDKYYNNKIDVDSGRSAIQFIIENYGFKRIWLPVYNCPLVAQRIRQVSDIKICWYNINEDFLPIVNIESIEGGDCLLWVNYCGIMQSKKISEVLELQNQSPVKIIIDNIPAYFSEPRMSAINIYSCRKFIGVPDGGHIIGDQIVPTVLPTYSTAENYTYLLKAIETGSNSAYDGYNESEKRFRESRIAYGMPVLTNRILKSVDYKNIIAKRKENFLSLHALLGNSNRFDLDTSMNTPSVYPYLCSDINLRHRLLDNKVYISRFWKHILTNELANEFEKDLAEYLIPLPIDQRYCKEDMEYIAKMVHELERN